ncbi:hypothetical protein [Pedobacter nanyangensis]|uniref:hypothetical protein n=1 Tax=Pedobacter nanyangensis TaxID=1562389 RepID=UPI000DE56813|nr:hypothetical protein [Pedobacter nanyangensis]
MKIQIKTNAAWAIVALCGLLACKSSPDYKKVRQEVMDKHDELMVDSELAIHNKMKLDTLAKIKLKEFKALDGSLDTAAEKKQIDDLGKLLDKADERMMDWMQEFQADVGNKSNDEAIAYFKAEMVKLKNMDQAFKLALSRSDAYLKKFDPAHQSVSSKDHGHAH